MSSKPNCLEVEVVFLLFWWWLTYPDLFLPMLTHADLSCPSLSWPDLSWAVLTWPVLTCANLYWPGLSCPDLSYPVWPVLTQANLCWPVVTHTDLSWPVLSWPPPWIMQTVLILEKIEIWWPPPLGPKLGKFLNLDYFEIFVPPFTLSKTIPKSYLTVTLGLFQSYISHICKKFAYISPIYDPFIILIKAIFQSFEFEKNMKIKISHPSHSNMHFELWTFYLRRWPPPPPPFGLFSHFCDILHFECFP